MIRVSRVLSTLVAAGLYAVALPHVRAATTNLSIEARAEYEAYTLHEPVRIIVTVSNVANVSIQHGAMDYPPMLRLFVEPPNGKAEALPRREEAADYGSRPVAPQTLPAGAASTRRILVHARHLLKPGVYRFWVKLGWPEITSRPAQIRVADLAAAEQEPALFLRKKGALPALCIGEGNLWLTEETQVTLRRFLDGGHAGSLFLPYVQAQVAVAMEQRDQYAAAPDPESLARRVELLEAAARAKNFKQAADALFALGSMLLRHGKTEEARRAFTKIVTQWPGSFDAQKARTHLAKMKEK